MEEVSRLFAGCILADKFKHDKNSLKFSSLIDSSMHGTLAYVFLLNWTPVWLRTYILNPIMSFFTKAVICRKPF